MASWWDKRLNGSKEIILLILLQFKKWYYFIINNIIFIKFPSKMHFSWYVPE